MAVWICWHLGLFVFLGISGLFDTWFDGTAAVFFVVGVVSRFVLVRVFASTQPKLVSAFPLRPLLQFCSFLFVLCGFNPATVVVEGCYSGVIS